MSTAESYRWNTSAAAEAYDQAAPAIHPHYTAVQDEILKALPFSANDEFLFVDLGGGSGRLAERILKQFAKARAIVVDQSEPFLALAERRLQPFAPRAAFIRRRLQDDWPAELPEPPHVIVSTSAIHHLEPHEKRALYARCHEALAPHGIFLNGDEFRPAADADYLALLQNWSAHMNSAIACGKIPAEFQTTLDQWHDRNIRRFGEPKKSGDDCLETLTTQEQYFRDAGFTNIEAPWSHDLWGLLIGRNS